MASVVSRLARYPSEYRLEAFRLLRNRLPCARRLRSKCCLTTINLVAPERRSSHFVSDFTRNGLFGGPGLASVTPVAWSRPPSCAHGVPVMTEHPGGLPDAHTVHHHGPANTQIRLHVIHPSHHPWGDYDPMDGGGRYSIQPPNVSSQAAHVVHFNSASYTRASSPASALPQPASKTRPWPKTSPPSGILPIPGCPLWGSQPGVGM